MLLVYFMGNIFQNIRLPFSKKCHFILKFFPSLFMFFYFVFLNIFFHISKQLILLFAILDSQMPVSRFRCHSSAGGAGGMGEFLSRYKMIDSFHIVQIVADFCFYVLDHLLDIHSSVFMDDKISQSHRRGDAKSQIHRQDFVLA